MAKIKAAAELVEKALKIWVFRYHFVIPRKMLQMYIRKFMHERSNIAKYSNRYFDPDDTHQYNQWLSFRVPVLETKPVPGITYIQETDHLHLSNISTEYVCIRGDDTELYPWFEDCIGNDADVIYFDHDSKDNSDTRCNPVLKPDFSYDTLRSFNYIGRCFVVKTMLMKQFEGEEWNPYLWLLKLSDKDLMFAHRSVIAYADNRKSVCEEKVLKKYISDKQINASATVNPDGISCTVQYQLDYEPLISIVIPTKDNLQVLKTCIDSILNKTTYSNYEIIIADNRSSQMATLDYFSALQKQHGNIHVFRIDEPFNYSRINNLAVAEASGEYYVLLNNDTEIITPDWLEKMLGYASQNHVGSVGALLYFADNTIQHGGVVVGKGGDAGHRWYQCKQDQKGYLYTLEAPNDVMCCTAACLMTSKRCWDEMHGMNEELTVQYNDVDYGIRLHKAGYYNVFLPGVKLYHYESKSRGIDKNRKAVKRYFEESEWMINNYSEEIKHDPFYNDAFDKNYDYKLIAGTGSN